MKIVMESHGIFVGKFCMNLARANILIRYRASRGVSGTLGAETSRVGVTFHVLFRLQVKQAIRWMSIRYERSEGKL